MAKPKSNFKTIFWVFCLPLTKSIKASLEQNAYIFLGHIWGLYMRSYFSLLSLLCNTRNNPIEWIWCHFTGRPKWTQVQHILISNTELSACEKKPCGSWPWDKNFQKKWARSSLSISSKTTKDRKYLTASNVRPVYRAMRSKVSCLKSAWLWHMNILKFSHETHSSFRNCQSVNHVAI